MAISWLLLNQSGDGSWRSGNHAEMQSTTNAVLALQSSGIDGYAYARSIAWIANAEPQSVDSLAHKILALNSAGRWAYDQRNSLLNAQNSARGWGAYTGYGTSFPDTALASNALRIDDDFWRSERGAILGAVCHIIASQKTGDASIQGSWSYYPQVNPALHNGATSSLIPTVYNLLEVGGLIDRGVTDRRCQGIEYNLSTVQNAAIDWLLDNRRNQDDGFGDNGVSTPLETALAIIALREVRPSDPAIATAMDYLIANQQPDGSWNGDPLSTAMVLRAFPPTTLADSDSDGIPDDVEAYTGTDSQVHDSRTLLKSNGRSISGITTAYSLNHNIGDPAIDHTLTVDGGSGDYQWSFSGDLPEGVTFDRQSGVLSGTPTEGGTYNFEYVAIDQTTGETTASVGQLVVNSAPVLQTIGDRVEDEGRSIDFAAIVSNPDEDVLTYTASGLPAGISINSATGRITGYLDSAAIGTHQVNITVSDGKAQDQISFSWTVNNVDLPPVVADIPNQSSLEGESIALQVEVTEPDAQPLYFAATGLPPGLSIDANGLISGDIAFTSQPTYTAQVEVRDGTSTPIIKAFTWDVANVNRAPVMDPLGTYQVTAGQALRIPLVASDPDGDNISYFIEGKDPFMELEQDPSNDWYLVVSPGNQDWSTYIVTVEVIDDAQEALQSSESVIVHVVPDYSDVTHVVSYSTEFPSYGHVKFELYGGLSPNTVSNFMSYANDGDYQYTIIDQAAGGRYITSGNLRINPDSGAYENVPVSAPLPVETTLSNGKGTVAMINLGDDTMSSPWLVNIYNNRSIFDQQQHSVFGRVIQNLGLLDALSRRPKDSTYQIPTLADDGSLYPIIFSDFTQDTYAARDFEGYILTDRNAEISLPVPFGGAGSYTYTITEGDLPAGLLLDSATGAITGMATQSGKYTFIYGVGDGSNLDSGYVQLNVNAAPVLSPIENLVYQEGETVSYFIDVDTPEVGETYTFGASGLPGGLQIDSSTGEIFGTLHAATAGEYPVKIIVLDGTLNTVQSLQITVNPADGLVVTNLVDRSIYEGESLVVDLSASGLEAALCFDTVSVIPAFAQFENVGDGVATLTFTPQDGDAGVYPITVEVGDKATLCDGAAQEPLFEPVQQSFVLTVEDFDQPPSIELVTDQSNVPGDSPVLQIDATDPESSRLEYYAVNLPPGLQIDQATGLTKNFKKKGS